MKRKSALKGIASYDKVIEEHKEKIMEEKRKPSPNMEVVKYWEKEIKNFIKNRKKLIGGGLSF